MDDPRIASFRGEADRIVQFLQTEFQKLQTGRASAAIVEHVSVEAYGTKQPLKTLAGITVQDARSIVIQPWDRSILQNVEKALQQADTGAMPVNDGTVIRLNLPPMTQERREQIVKSVHAFAEEARISIRQQRQHVLERIKAEEKDEDARYTFLDQLQKLVELANATIEDIVKKKEQEVMTV